MAKHFDEVDPAVKTKTVPCDGFILKRSRQPVYLPRPSMS